MEIRSLAGTDFDVIFHAFGQAFADYEMQLDKAELQTMLKRRGFDPGLSFAAFDGDEIAAFTFNGVGGFNGTPTAYDTGTGTRKEYRGQGLATNIFEYSIPHLREAGIGQYLLEVLQHNTAAVSVYRKLGFEVTREFNYFNQESGRVNAGVGASEGFSVRPIDIGQLRSAAEFWDFSPSWQNSFESIERAAEDFIAMGAFEEGRLLGYSIFAPVSGDITQLAVDKRHRRRGIGSLLLREMMKLNRCGSVKALNADIECESVTGFMKARNIELRGRQFEMIRKI